MHNVNINFIYSIYYITDSSFFFVLIYKLFVKIVRNKLYTLCTRVLTNILNYIKFVLIGAVNTLYRYFITKVFCVALRF